jgi:putative exosortase-associated protein (TIGR04073 family)
MPPIRGKLKTPTQIFAMRKTVLLFSAIAAAATLTGCSGPEQKLSRGLNNTFEVVRWGDMRHDVESDAVFSTPDVNYTYGAIHGFNQSVTRFGLGLYEVVTFPIPNHPTHWDYKPVCTNYIPTSPQYPESYKPGLISGSTFDTDTYTGFSGGDVAPFVPGSRFKIFDN